MTVWVSFFIRKVKQSNESSGVNVLQITSLLEQLRHSAAWLSEDTRLEFWRKCQSLLIEHDVTALTAANFLQVSHSLCI